MKFAIYYHQYCIKVDCFIKLFTVFHVHISYGGGHMSSLEIEANLGMKTEN